MFGGRDFGKGRHAHHGAGEDDDESGTVGDLEVADGDGETLWATKFGGVVGEGVLGFRHAQGEAVESVLAEQLDFRFSGIGQMHAISAIDARGDGVKFVFDGVFQFVELGKGDAFFRQGGEEGFGEVDGTVTSLSEDVGGGAGDVALLAEFVDESEFLLAVVGESVNGDDDRSLKLGGAVEVGGEVLQSCGKSDVVGVGEGVEWSASVHLEGADGGDDDDGFGLQSGLTAFDAHEFFAAEVEGKSAFGDGEVGMGKGHAGGKDGVAAVGDVGKGTAVDECGHAFDGLHEVGFDGVTEDGKQGAGDPGLFGENSAAVFGEADHDTVESGLQVLQGFGQAENGHHFRGGGDVESGGAFGGFARRSVDLAQAAVVDIQNAFPKHALGFQVGLAIEELIVDDGGQQVVGAGDGVEVAGEVEVDGVGRMQGAASTAGGSPFAAKYRAHGGLTQGKRDALPGFL